MSHEVIMPVLGMNQDNGVIANWCKNRGDFVEVGDVLMEIETDKAIQEIESYHRGYLSQIIFEAGKPVPVGEVIAVIAENQDDVNMSVAKQPAKLPEPVAEEKIAEPTTPTVPTTPVSPSIPTQQSRSHKILASPKAKYLARQKGYSLDTIAAQQQTSVVQAHHVENYQPAQIPSHTPASNTVTIRCCYDGIKICEAWLLEQQQGRTIGHLIAALIVAEMRKSNLTETPDIWAKVDSWDGTQITTSFLHDPDLTRFSLLECLDSAPVSTNLHVLYLGDSRITSIELNSVDLSTILVKKIDNELQLKFTGFAPEQLSAWLKLAEQMSHKVEHPLLFIA